MEKRSTNPSANYWRTATQRGKNMTTPISKTNPNVNPRTSASEVIKSRVPAGGEVDRSQYAGKDPVQRRDERPA
jgi:hypothetical protein